MFESIPDATPLDADTEAGLIPTITTQAELNEFEERNMGSDNHWNSKPG